LFLLFRIFFAFCSSHFLSYFSLFSNLLVVSFTSKFQKLFPFSSFLFFLRSPFLFFFTGEPFQLTITLKNQTEKAYKELILTMESDQFLFSGCRALTLSLPPFGTMNFDYVLIPLRTGNAKLPLASLLEGKGEEGKELLEF